MHRRGNAAGEVLLIRRSDNGNWAVPGGAIDLGESMVQAAVRANTLSVNRPPGDEIGTPGSPARLPAISGQVPGRILAGQPLWSMAGPPPADGPGGWGA